MTLPESFLASMIVRNWKPGPPESDNCIPAFPAAKSASDPAHRARFVPAVLFSNTIFNTVDEFEETAIPVIRYLLADPTVPVIVIICYFPLISLTLGCQWRGGTLSLDIVEGYGSYELVFKLDHISEKARSFVVANWLDY